MNEIFVSYRRSDASAVVGRVIDRLESSFGTKHVFRDLDSIDYGQNFGEVINQALADCEVLLVIIGKKWIGAQDESGKRRLANSGDWVRLEVSKALNQCIHVIPVLVENADMPTTTELPEDLKPLAQRTAAKVRDDPDFDRDMERLCEAIGKHLSDLRLKVPKPLAKRMMLVVSPVLLCAVLLTAYQLGWIGLKVDDGTHAQPKDEPVARMGNIDIDALIARLRSEVRKVEIDGMEVKFREPTDQDLIEYLDTVAKEAELVADAWSQLQKELAKAAARDEEEWSRLVGELRNLAPPNAKYFANLTSFYTTVVEISDRTKPRSEAISRFIDHTEEIIEARGDAVDLLAALVSDGPDSGAHGSIPNKERVKELSDIIGTLNQEAADLRALAFTVRKRLI